MKKFSLKRIEELVKELMEGEDRKDVEFRHVIATTEVGDIGKYITHDPELNPNARPHGTKEDEVLAYGQAFVQLAALAYLRGIPLEEAFAKGIKNWMDRDWKKKQGYCLNEKLTGIAASPGTASGVAEVIKGRSNGLGDTAGKVLVVEYATPELASYVTKSLACVSDHGGATCHLANIAREYNIPCVVGTGNATALIKTGDTITVDGGKGEVLLQKK